MINPSVCASVSFSVCVSLCLSVRELISATTGSIFHDFLCRSTVAVARSSSGGVAIRYVGPASVLWMMSRLAVVDRVANWRCVEG